jgi:hypothetical protein
MPPLLVNAIMVVLAWIVAGLISWGYMDLIRQLDRIELKLDRIGKR